MSSSRRSTPMSSLSNKSSLLNHTTGSKTSSDSPDHSTQSSFEWGEYLTSTKSHAAPVSSFIHAPLHQMWMQVDPGMKLEVINHDCSPNMNGNKERVYWFAAVIRIEGYMALLRYEGYGDDSSMDFWQNLCDKDIHCVGWCGQYGVKLAPPRNIENRQTDWKTFLVSRLVGSKTMPDNFHDKLQASLRCPFKKNMILEVIDKHRVSQMRVGEITEVIGDRLKIYYDNMVDEHFSVHYTSNLIHPLGWSARVGHEIESELKPKINGRKASITNAAPADIFAHVSIPSPEEEQFKEGQKLEAVDPLDMSRICPATIVKVMKDGYFMLSIDNSGVDDGADWFCYHRTSRLIFPINFCQMNNIPLSPPDDYHGEFQWEEYLSETKSTSAPRHLFQVVKERVKNPFTVGMKLEAVDMMAPHLICVASIAQVADNLIRLHFDGWNENFEQWIDCRSPNIYPIGWCEIVGHQLESPQAAESEQLNTGSEKIPRRKSTNRKSNKRKRLN